MVLSEEEQQHEIDAAWAEHRRLENEKEQRELDADLAEHRRLEDNEAETCACGYSRERFNCIDPDCLAPGYSCGCPEPREVNLGDGPGGFKIYE